MSGRHAALTSRRIRCETCHAQPFEYCVNADGSARDLSHPARVAASKACDHPVTPKQMEVLQALQADPTKYMEPIVRKTLRQRGLITTPDPPTGPHLSRRTKPPKRRFYLTSLGLTAIGAKP